MSATENSIAESKMALRNQINSGCCTAVIKNMKYYINLKFLIINYSGIKQCYSLDNNISLSIWKLIFYYYFFF